MVLCLELYEKEYVYMTEDSPSTEDIQATRQAIESLRVTVGAEYYFEAAEPNYRSSFTRDSLITMLLSGEKEWLASQINYSARRIGQTKNPMTGEEPGKAHHELPGALLRDGLSTSYNACDTTAELLRSIAALYEHGDETVLGHYASIIEQCTGYIAAHVGTDGLFRDDPLFSGFEGVDGHERKYALKVTYWKDSELNRPGQWEPNYPIVYSLAHFQNAAAVRRIGAALGDNELRAFGDNMIKKGLELLWRGDHFVTAIDADGEIDGVSSDSLFSLLFIPPEFLVAGQATQVQVYM
jgi:hypothetical protein